MSKLRFGEGSKPNHAARAVDITTVFSLVPAGESARHKAAAVAGARGKSVEPMSTQRRGDAYAAQTGRLYLTARQSRRLMKKHRATGQADV